MDERDEVLDFIDKLGQQKPKSRVLIGIAKVFRFCVLLGVAFTIAWQGNNLGDKPIGMITPNELFRNAVVGVLSMGCLWWAFQTMDDEAAESWLTWGLLLGLIPGIMTAIFLLK